jgi:TPP-dependent pyruvate/acetoin dehydrogenase alpha subunit
MAQEELPLSSQLYSIMLTIRRFEEAAIAQYRAGNIRGYLHPYIGQEAIAAGAISALEPQDLITSTHRGHGHAIAKGHDVRLMMAELFGKETGYCRGMGGSMHVSSINLGNLGANGIVGGGMPIAAGAALGLKLRGEKRVVACFFSDGAANNGVFHETLNMAALYDLPVIFILENNHYAVSTPVSASTRVQRLSDRGASYGMPAYSVDGNDALAVHRAMNVPVQQARSGRGPSLLECLTYRGGGHHVNDPGLYMPEDEVAQWRLRDPIELMRARLLAAGVTQAEIASAELTVEHLIEEAIQFALDSPVPSEDAFLASLG